ncbi:MAG: secretion protein HlyD, partial [Pirellulaceae bacterium]
MRLSKLQIRWLSIIGAVLLASILGLVLRDRWLPVAKQWITPIQEPADDPSEDGQSESGHGHPHAGHDETTTLELSKKAGQNIGLQTAKVELQPFERTIAVPAMVVERPGRSRVEVTAPLTGVVTRIFPIEAEAIQPGQLLY